MKNIIKMTVFILLTIVFTIMIGKMLIPRNLLAEGQGDLFNIKGYYHEKKNSLDILFIGSSSVYRTVSPMIIWEEEGITSYDYSIPAARIYMSYYFVEDALRTQKPKVIFLDISTAYYKVEETEPERRKGFDYMKFSKTKIDIMKDKQYTRDFDFLDKVSMVFPIFRYKDRITSPNVDYYLNDYHSITKGYVFGDGFNPQKDNFKYMEPNNRKVEMSKLNEEYLLKIRDLCDKNNIDIVFVGFPNSWSWNKASSDHMTKFCEKHKIPYIELNTPETGLDWTIDTMDRGNHVNVFGAEKETKYIINYINDNYKFKSHKKEKEYSQWNKDLIEYKKLDKVVRENSKPRNN